MNQQLQVHEKAYFYPNRGGRIVLTALEDIMGSHGVNAVLNLAQLDHLVNNYPPNNLQLGFSFADFGILEESLEKMFGERGGRGLSLRAGRETFKYLLKEFMPVIGIADLAMRALPLSIKLKIGLDIFAESFNRFSNQVVRLREDKTHYLWIIERCPVCWNRKTTTPCCQLAVGLLEESSYWVSNGKTFQVEEIECIAAGGKTCTIAISKKPIK